jgi:glycine/D-amino acid oxidase-like deaminating enzyme/nitrite reductase/ring-hydroxylating ferredoxin subunit
MAAQVDSKSIPIWYENSTSTRYPKLNYPAQVDVCIVGAGIAGLMTAYQLLKAGKTVAILESRQIGSGETGNTSAHLCTSLDDHYYHLQDLHGNDGAALAAASHATALNELERIIKTENIECDFVRIPGILYTGDNTDDVALLDREFEAAKSCGLKNVMRSNTPKDHTFNLGQYLVFPNQARFHPLQFLTALAKIITDLGGKIYENSHVSNIDRDTNLAVSTTTGHTVRAEHVVTATNAPFQTSLGTLLNIVPNRSYAIGAIVPKGSVLDALYWDTDTPYHYIRIQPQDDKTDCLIIGGEDHRVGIMAKANPFLELESWAIKRFPQITSFPYRWSGQILEPLDSLPYIGKHPSLENTYVVTGDSGDGLTSGAIASLLIADLICGKENPWEQLYSLNRKSKKPTNSLLKNAWESTLSYVKYAAPQNFKSSKSIARNEGAIVLQDKKLRAVFKDKNLHEKPCTAVCSHMGALLQWNTIEKTWDCPAHGSRFDVDGNVLCGPALKGLSD